MLILLALLAFSSPKPTIEQKIKTLAPHLKKVPKWIPQTLRANAKRILPGVPMNLILAMIQKESSFIHFKHKVGSYGEWGLLQVIPWEGHIKRAALKYRCLKSERKYNRYKKWNNGFFNPPWKGKRAQDPVDGKWFKVHARSPRVKIKGRWYVFRSKGNLADFKVETHKPTHKIAWYNPCRCAADSKTDCSYPNVGYMRNGSYRPTMTKTTLFLRFSPRGALVTGLWELRYWRTKYDRIYKRRFWTKPPTRHFRKRGYNVPRSIKWWKRVKKDLGNYAWIVHHNYGGRLVLSQTARWYPYLVAKFMKKLDVAQVASAEPGSSHKAKLNTVP